MSAQPEPKPDQERSDWSQTPPRVKHSGAETVVPFDTLQYAKRLQSANVPPEQAEVQAEAIRQILVATKADVHLAAERVIDYTELKTERINSNMILSIDRVDSDMREAFARTDGHIRDVKADLKSDIARESEQLSERFTAAIREAQADNREAIEKLRGDVKADLSNQLKWVVGTMLAGLGGVVGIMALLLSVMSPNQAVPAQQPAPIIQQAPISAPPAVVAPDQPAPHASREGNP